MHANIVSTHLTNKFSAPIRVIKLGGSLLTWPVWPNALQNWLTSCDADISACDAGTAVHDPNFPEGTNAEPQIQNFVVVGGGGRADQVRRDQKIHGWTDEESHGKAIDAMDENAIDVARTLDWPLCRDLKTLTMSQAHARRNQVVLASCFANDLPERSWDLTSDCVAFHIYLKIRKLFSGVRVRHSDNEHHENQNFNADSKPVVTQENLMVNPGLPAELSVLPAPTFVLLKSQAPAALPDIGLFAMSDARPDGGSASSLVATNEEAVRHLSEIGLIDSYFPTMYRSATDEFENTSVQISNLRAE